MTKAIVVEFSKYTSAQNKECEPGWSLTCEEQQAMVCAGWDYGPNLCGFITDTNWYLFCTPEWVQRLTTVKTVITSGSIMGPGKVYDQRVVNELALKGAIDQGLVEIRFNHI